MRDPRLLDYSPPRAAAIKSDLMRVKELLWAVYTHRDKSPVGYIYEGTGEIQYRQRHLILAQSQLTRKLDRLVEIGSAILIYISSLDDVVKWRGEVRRASVDDTLIDPDDPNPPGKEIISAIATIDEWIEELEVDISWTSYATRYVRQNRIQLLLALSIGVLSKILLGLVSSLLPLIAFVAPYALSWNVVEQAPPADG